MYIVTLISLKEICLFVDVQMFVTLYSLPITSAINISCIYFFLQKSSYNDSIFLLSHLWTSHTFAFCFLDNKNKTQKLKCYITNLKEPLT